MDKTRHLQENNSNTVERSFPQLISTRNALIVGISLAALFVVGVFYDFQIAEALFDPTNPVGVFGAAYGEFPSGAAMLIGGLMLILFRNRSRTAIMVTQLVLGGLLTLFGTFMLMFLPTMYIEGHLAVLLVISAVFVGAVFWFTIRGLQGADRKLAIRVATVMLLVVVAELLIVNVLKVGWARPRMRMMAVEPGASFVPIYQPGAPSFKDALMSSGVPGEEFKSFPSGHTANAALLIVFTALTVLKKSWLDIRQWVFWIGALWGAYVGFSRLIMGAHFLTDTVIGYAVTFISVLVAFRIAFPSPSNTFQRNEIK